MKDRLAEATTNIKKGGGVCQIVLFQGEWQVLADLLLSQYGLTGYLKCAQQVPQCPLGDLSISELCISLPFPLGLLQLLFLCVLRASISRPPVIVQLRLVLMRPVEVR